MLPISADRRRALLKRMRKAAEYGELRPDVIEYLDGWQLPKELKTEALQAYDQRLRALTERR